MPYRISKVRGGVRVTSKGRTLAKKTSLSKAKKQVRLLRAIDHGFKPRRKNKK